MGKVNIQEVSRLAQQWRDKSPLEIIAAAVDSIPELTFACSFGAEDMVLLDLVMQVKKDLPIFYLDTDVLFPETYALRDAVIAQYSPNLIRVGSKLTLSEQEAQLGAELWKRAPDKCCDVRKVQPLEGFLARYAGWITGIRREQSPTRANTEVFEVDTRFNMIKVNPLTFWSEDQVWSYIKDHGVPYNPLHDQGYPSIGCLHCTRPVQPGDDPRSGRWAGFAKTECGLHGQAG